MFEDVAAWFQAEKTREIEAAWELPKAAFCAAQLVDDQVQVAWAADCSVLKGAHNGVTWLTGTPDTAEEAADASAVAADAAGTITGAVLADRRAHRAQADHAALSPDAAHSASITQHASFEVAPGDDILLMSDGFSALVSDYRRYNGKDLMEKLRAVGLAALVTEIRAIEQEDAACKRYPRFKVSDDTTALWLRVFG